MFVIIAYLGLVGCITYLTLWTHGVGYINDRFPEIAGFYGMLAMCMGIGAFVTIASDSN